jgi:endo-1,4-beta-xylanase
MLNQNDPCGAWPGRTTVALLLCVIVFLPSQSRSQLAKGNTRFVGCAIEGFFHSDFPKYWNQVTPGNAGKWGSVEGSQDSYDWTPLDNTYNYALNNSFRYKHHTLVWGNQQPVWITSLDSASQRAQVEEWIRLVGERYGSMSFVDVVNEPFHAPPSYSNALGGSGATGWDWVITAFRWARQYCIRGVKLVLNEYNVLHDTTVTSNYLRLIDTLRVRGLIDAIGVQGHYFEFKSAAGDPNPYTWPIPRLKYNLDRLVATGLPVYITEFDINEADDNVQLQNYQTYFPLFWENSGVSGMTLWGYVQGDVWKTNAYLVRSDGSERPALQWLRRYLATPLPPVLVSPVGTAGEPRNPRLAWRTSAIALSYRLQVSTSRAFSTVAVDTTVTDTSLRVSPLAANTTFYWHATASNDTGTSAYSAIASFTTGDQVVGIEEISGVPEVFWLSQNFPNPFNPSTTIRYDVPKYVHVKIAVYDVLGREIAVLVDEDQPAGHYSIAANATNLPSGAYFYRMNAGDFGAVRKLLVIR